MMPLQFTDAALMHIKNIIAKQDRAMGFRLTVKQTGCSGYMYIPEVVNYENENDIKILHPTGITIYIDPACVELIRGTVVDYVKKSFGMKQLIFQNPNATSLCGCGESFNLKDPVSD